MIMVGVAADAAAAAAAVHDRDLVAIHTVPLISLATHTAHLNHMLGRTRSQEAFPFCKCKTDAFQVHN